MLLDFKKNNRRLPVPSFSLKRYLNSLPSKLNPARELESAAEGLAHFITVGVYHGAVFMPTQLSSELAIKLQRQFDIDSYEESLDAAGIELPGNLNPFKHYLGAGCCLGLSPRRDYNETAYLLRYPDIRKAISSAKLKCGFVHFIDCGLNEERLGEEFDPASYLRSFYPYLLDSSPSQEAESLKRYIFFDGAPPIQVSIGSAGRSLLLALHAIDTEIKFGGMSALYRIIDAIVEKFAISHIDLVLTDQPSQTLGALYQISKKEHPLNKYSEIIRVHCLTFDENGRAGYSSQTAPMAGINTIAIAYNAKSAYLMNKIKTELNGEPFQWYYLIQEDESSFYGCGSLSSAVRNTYSLDFLPIFNSCILKEYMQSKYPSLADRRSHHFMHQYILPSKPVFPAEKTNIIICYFRPEKHADRNCHQVITLSLIHCLRERPSMRNWQFIGVGSLSDFDMPLSDGITMKCFSKLTYQDYSQILRISKIGISLMDAPHPSVVPFEMAGHGVTVITNSYPSRSESDIQRMSPGYSINVVDLEVTSISNAIFNSIDEFDQRSTAKDLPCAFAEALPLERRWEIELQGVTDFICQTSLIPAS